MLALWTMVVAATAGPGPCSLDGTWNALGSGKGTSSLVNISQPVGSNNLTVQVRVNELE